MVAGFLAGVIGMLASGPADLGYDGYLRARATYRAAARGEISLDELSLRQRAELAEIDRRIRNGETFERSPRERCFEAETRRHGGTPSALDREVIELACSQR